MQPASGGEGEDGNRGRIGDLHLLDFHLFTFRFPISHMPSFDIVSEIERMEIENAVNQAVKELATRFDFKGSSVKIELTKPELITLSAEDANKLKGVREIMVNKLAKRGVDLRNVEQKEPSVSSIGNTRQEFVIMQGLEGTKAKEITTAIKAEKFKVQASLQDRQVRVTGTKRDELQEVIAFLRAKDFGVSLSFKNFRD
jgi:cyclic-di-GMP-binding protein